MNKNYLITHWDADGVGCWIVLSQVLKFEKILGTGYKSLDKKLLQASNFEPGSTIYITDIAVSEDQLAQFEGKDLKIVYIDHHPTSQLIDFSKFPSVIKHYADNTMSASAKCFELVNNKSNLTPEIANLIKEINIFDIHAFDKKYSNKVPFYLNELFWADGFYDFFNNFKNGLNDSTENLIIRGKRIFEEKLEAVKEEDRFFIEDVCINFDVSSLNYLKILYGSKINYYLAFYDEVKCSVRFMHEIPGFYEKVMELDEVKGAGGHPLAGAIEFNNKVNFDIIEKIVEIVLKMTRG